MELNFEVTRAVLFLKRRVDFSVRTDETNTLVIKFLNHKHLTWFQELGFVIGHNTQPVSVLLELL